MGSGTTAIILTKLLENGEYVVVGGLVILILGARFGIRWMNRRFEDGSVQPSVNEREEAIEDPAARKSRLTAELAEMHKHQ